MTKSEAIEIKLLQKSRILEVMFSDGKHFSLSCEYLRVYSPSAEVQGHSVKDKVLVTGKQDVNIIDIEPVGQYAVKLVFDDGHQTGLYTWDYLYELGSRQQENWAAYLEALNEARYT